MSATLWLTPHAKMRRKQMKVTEHEIERAIADPETVYPSDSRCPDYRPGVKLYQRGRIVVVLDADERTVITVLWHRKEGRD